MTWGHCVTSHAISRRSNCKKARVISPPSPTPLSEAPWEPRWGGAFEVEAATKREQRGMTGGVWESTGVCLRAVTRLGEESPSDVGYNLWHRRKNIVGIAEL